MILSPDCTIIHPVPYRSRTKAPGPDALLAGDVVALLYDDPYGCVLQGTITGHYQGDRYKVEVTDIDGQTYRYSVPRDLLRLVRRAEA